MRKKGDFIIALYVRELILFYPFNFTVNTLKVRWGKPSYPLTPDLGDSFFCTRNGAFHPRCLLHFHVCTSPEALGTKAQRSWRKATLSLKSVRLLSPTLSVLNINRSTSDSHRLLSRVEIYLQLSLLT